MDYVNDKVGYDQKVQYSAVIKIIICFSLSYTTSLYILDFYYSFAD